MLLVEGQTIWGDSLHSAHFIMNLKPIKKLISNTVFLKKLRMKTIKKKEKSLFVTFFKSHKVGGTAHHRLLVTISSVSPRGKQDIKHGKLEGFDAVSPSHSTCLCQKCFILSLVNRDFVSLIAMQ
jgi:hypothetical protein